MQERDLHDFTHVKLPRRIGSQQPMRLVGIKYAPHQECGGRPEQELPRRGESMLIATDLLDVAVETSALIYQQPWTVETFFRFFKHLRVAGN